MKLDALKALQTLYQNDSDQIAYLLKDGSISYAQLQSLINQVADYLDSQSCDLAAIYTDETHHAATLILGAWLANKTPVLLPNNLPATIDNFVKDYAALFCDEEIVDQIQVSETNLTKPAANTIHNDMPLAFFTSGSTGKPVLCYKTSQQLLNEIQTLEHTFAAELKADTVICSGASHQHIYGFLFKLLWPLLTSRQVISPCYKNINEIEFPDNHLCWITSPAQLKRMPPQLNNNLKIDCIFSSGSALDYSTAQQTKQLLDTYPIEVYGSTETGGIAFRQQSIANQPYQAFNNVQIQQSAEGLLQIQSPHLPDDNWFEVQDKIDLISTREFNLQGRADRISKIEGKRVSLDELENRLAESPLCQECYTLRRDTSGRQLIGAAVVLSKQGRILLAQQGRKALIKHLDQWLGEFFEPVFIPRKWRFLSSMPRNTQHKINATEIEIYFDSPAIHTDPIILSLQESTSDNLYRILVPRDLIYFHGHFPQLAVLPGVVQIKWVLNLLENRHSNLQVGQLKNLKFNNPIIPGDDLELSLVHLKDKHTYKFRYSAKQISFSSGELIYTLAD